MRNNFLRNSSGQMAMMTALLAFPIFGVTGLAIDYTRISQTKSAMQQAADSAVLAAASTLNVRNRERKKLSNKVFWTNFEKPDGGKRFRGKLIPLDDGYRYEASGRLNTILMQLFGTRFTNISVIAEVGKASDGVEVALVLDTTGSMAGSMDDLKGGAKTFVDIVSDASAGQAKFAVVPFTAAVNVGRHLARRQIDRNADSQYHAHILENRNVFFDAGASCGAPADPDGGSTEERAGIYRLYNGLFGVSAAHAQSTGAHIGLFEPDWDSSGPCHYGTPPKQNNLQLFDNIGVRWKGCVEARPGDLDVSDDPARNSDPDSKWVPYFWPDEEPRGTPAVTHNHYMTSDYNSLSPDISLVWPYNWQGTHNPEKYSSSNTFNIDSSAPDTLGPNKSCPDELLPLTDNETLVKQTIDDLNYWNDGGTIASEGVAWGFRALSPSAPLSQGEKYRTDVKKVLVLFGDGKNGMPVNIDNSPMITDYGAYGYAGSGRLSQTGVINPVYSTPSGSSRIAKIEETTQAFLDERMAKACQNAKDKDIHVLTILFNETDAATKELYKQCATDTSGAISATSKAELQSAFQDVANQILKLHIRR